MSLTALKWAREQRGLSLAQKLILLELAFYCNDSDDEFICFPSVAKIVDRLEISERTVRSSLADLEGLGHIRRQARYRPDGSQTSNSYTLNVRVLVEQTGIKTSYGGGGAGADGDTKQVRRDGMENPAPQECVIKKGPVKSTYSTEVEYERYRAPVDFNRAVYAFNGKVIKLNREDYLAWKGTYSKIDLEYELRRLDIEYAYKREQGGNVKKWFYEVSLKLKFQNDKIKNRPKRYFDSGVPRGVSPV